MLGEGGKSTSRRWRQGRFLLDCGLTFDTITTLWSPSCCSCRNEVSTVRYAGSSESTAQCSLISRMFQRLGHGSSAQSTPQIEEDSPLCSTFGIASGAQEHLPKGMVSTWGLPCHCFACAPLLRLVAPLGACAPRGLCCVLPFLVVVCVALVLKQRPWVSGHWRASIIGSFVGLQGIDVRHEFFQLRVTPPRQRHSVALGRSAFAQNVFAIVKTAWMTASEILYPELGTPTTQRVGTERQRSCEGCGVRGTSH